MEVIEIIKRRRSIRRYKPDPVPDSDIMTILEAARWAPSAGNLQPWEFVVVKDGNKRVELAKAAYRQGWIAEAPVIIVVCAAIERTARYYGERGASLYCIQDTAAATQNILLSACALGYGTCWVGAFNEDRVRKILGLPGGVRPVALVTLGKPAELPSPPPRRPLDSIVHLNSW